MSLAGPWIPLKDSFRQEMWLPKWETGKDRKTWGQEFEVQPGRERWAPEGCGFSGQIAVLALAIGRSSETHGLHFRPLLFIPLCQWSDPPKSRSPHHSPAWKPLVHPLHEKALNVFYYTHQALSVVFWGCKDEKVVLPPSSKTSTEEATESMNRDIHTQMYVYIMLLFSEHLPSCTVMQAHKSQRANRPHTYQNGLHCASVSISAKWT